MIGLPFGMEIPRAPRVALPGNRKHTGRAGRKATRCVAKVTAHRSPLKRHGSGMTASAIANRAARAARLVAGQ